MPGVTVQSSVLKKAENNETESISMMFSNFIGEDEHVVEAKYFGKYGLLIKQRSFVCLTDKRVASIIYKRTGELIYNDAYLEEINSGVVYQPSLVMLYAIGAILAISIVGILLLDAWIKLYYTFNKSGFIWNVREGVSIYSFANRGRINDATEFWRKASEMRILRVEQLK